MEGTASSFEQSNREIVTKWLNRLESRTGLTTYDFLEDASGVLTSQHALDPDEIDQCNYISWASPQYKSWLNIDRASLPSLLTINLLTPPGIRNPINALSFTTARTAIAFRMQQGPHKNEEIKPHSPKWPVLAFFCRQRNTASRNANVSGAPALVQSLCAQLLEWIALFRPGIDLATSIRNKDFFRGARKDIDNALRLFRALLVVLRDDHQTQNQERPQQTWPNPQVQPVWILIEGLSCLTVAQSTSESHNMIAAVWRILEEVSRPPQRNSSGGSASAPGLATKLLVTDVFGSSPINKVGGPGVYTLHVSDTPTIAGGARGVLDGGDAAREFSRLVDRHLAGNNSNEEDVEGRGEKSGKGGKKKRSRNKGRSKARAQSESDSEKSSSEEDSEEEESSSGNQPPSKGKKASRKREEEKKKSGKKNTKTRRKGGKGETGSESESRSADEDESGESEAEDGEESEGVFSASGIGGFRGKERRAAQKAKAKRKARKGRSKLTAQRASESESSTDEYSE